MGIASRFRILGPLRIRDFALLWAGMTVSMLGDGIYLVAIAWQVYALSNSPTALSLVGVAWTAPTVVFLLAGGVLSDRLDRRKVLIFSDVVRGLAIGAIGAMAVAGVLELWHLYFLVALYGAGEAFFGPAFGAIVPDIVPGEMLFQANSVGQFARPLAARLVGPAVGGLVVGLAGPGAAFLIDAGTFAVSAACLALMRAQPVLRERDITEGGTLRSALAEIAEGFRFVRSLTWLWAGLLSAVFVLLFWLGPYNVLLPFVIKNRLGGGAGDLGLVLAAGGVGALATALLVAQRGPPRRHILVMYVSFAISVLLTATFAVVTATWQAMVVGAVMGATSTVGVIIWGTLMQTLVPRELQGRVQSLDWLVSIALVPVSFALTGPVAAAIGVGKTLVAAGVLGGLGQLVFLLIPGIFRTEREGSLSERHS